MEFQSQEKTDPKTYFLKNNGLDRILYNLDFSVLQKYRCFANCKNCYTKDLWIPAKQIENYIPAAINESLRSQLFKVFEYFDKVSIIDDLKFIKDGAPHLWSFYMENQNLFYLSSLNDNAVLRHFPLLTQEFFPQGINEICLSEDFMNRQNSIEFLGMLEKIHQRVPIKNITFYARTDEMTTIAIQMHQWCLANEVKFKSAGPVPNNIIQNWASRSQSIFLMHDRFYNDLKTATTAVGQSYASLDDFDSRSFLAQTLNARMVNYNQFIRQNLNVYVDYNFIPLPVLPPFTKFYKTLISKGLAVETKYGLLFHNSDSFGPIKPLMDFKTKE